MALVVGRNSYFRPRIRFSDLTKTICIDFLRCCSTSESVDEPVSSRGKRKFRVLEFYRRGGERVKRTKRDFLIYPPRTTKMKPDMDWTNIWPGPRTFHPAVVPLPIRQGVNKHGPTPGKYANTELMKIPNFLHLTPPAIEKHCKALKRFCTQWPESLKTDEDIEKHFPIEIVSSDYCHSSCSIREPLARMISLKVKLKNLVLDKHAKDKFLRLVGPRYDPETDVVTITTDSCPIKKQNYEHAHYLLTALYFEAWKFEEWEKLKSDDDMEEYIFSKRQSIQNVKSIFDYNKKELPKLDEFGKAVEEWQNKGDDPTVINSYKVAALKLLSMPPLEC